MNRDAMLRLVKAWKKANDTDETLQELGYNTTPYEEIAGNIADAIYYILGEQTNTFDESVTFRTLSNFTLSAEKCTDILMAAYEKKTHVSDPTTECLNEEADKRGMELDALVKMILSEWALKCEYLKKIFNK